MPASSGPSSGAGAGAPGGGTAQRTTFRPPWVKDGPPPIPMPSQPWTPIRRDSTTSRDQPPPVPFGPAMLRKTSQSQPSQDGGSSASSPPADPKANLRKTSKITIVPSQPQPQPSPPQPQLKPVETAREVKVPITREPSSAPKENGQPTAVPIKRAPPQKKDSVDQWAPPSPPQPAKSPIPPPPPAPPAPPPPPPGMPGMEPMIERKPLTEKQRRKLDALRNRPRRRPDYGNLMKEIEGGAKLRKVQCNDRSSPLLPKVKAKGQMDEPGNEWTSHPPTFSSIQPYPHVNTTMQPIFSPPLYVPKSPFVNQNGSSVPPRANGFYNGSVPTIEPRQPKDECDEFGSFVADELRRFGSDFFRRKAKRRVQQALIEAAEEEEMIASKPCSCSVTRDATPSRESLSQNNKAYDTM